MAVDRSALALPATLSTQRLRLEPLGLEHLGDVWAGLGDREAMRLTGTHTRFTEDAVRRHLGRLAGRDDRADWAILDAADGRYLGEAVLNDLEVEDESMNYRIALAGGYGRGVGTEATALVIAHGFDVVGLHRISLSVFAFNARARRVYQKCGFQAEGYHRDVLHWDGEWYDDVSMAMLATDPRNPVGGTS